MDVLGSTFPGSGGRGRRRCGGGQHWEETPCQHHPVACSGQTNTLLTNTEIQLGLKTWSPECQSDALTNCVYEPILCSNTRAPVVQLVRPSDWHPDSSSGLILMSFLFNN